MDLKLEKKTALVTGSTVGIGFAIAERLAQEGASVVINGRTQERIDEAVERIQKKHPKSHVRGILADVSTPSGADHLIAKLPTVDILINNFGIYEPKPFAEITDGEWLHLFELNVMSGVRLSRAYLPKMLEKNWGRINFISSESGIKIPVEMIHYGLSKTAQLALSSGLAQMTVGTEVTVNSILPGPTRSEGVETFLSDMAKSRGVDEKTIEREFFKTVRPTSLLQRFATTEEVAPFVAFVCSPLAVCINGASLRVEGGIIHSII